MKAGEYVDVWALSRTGHHVLKLMKWGLVPTYFRGFPNEWHGNTSHARIETVHELPSFKESWEKKWRVLFPMAHYLQKTTGMQDLSGPTPGEVRVNIGRSDGEPMAVAGIYCALKRPSGLFLSCAMLTRPASPGLENINQRFPLVIERGDVAAWLDGSDDLDLATPPPAELFSISLAA
jgi:putative SOS response-associated peptidase YedK